MEEKMLKLIGVNKKYKLDGKKTFQALFDVNVEFAKGELVSIVGESGSGKSTLMNLIGGLDSNFSGDIFAGGENLRKLSDKQLDKYRKNKVGFVFQSFNLISHLSILDNVTLALTLSNVSEKEKVLRASNILKRVGLSNQLKKKPTQLSGGQKQRVAIARALINDPEIIIADEPTGALDSETSMQILEILKEIADSGKLVIMVTHSEKVASISSRVVEISDGRIISDKQNEAYQKLPSSQNLLAEVDADETLNAQAEKLETQTETTQAQITQIETCEKETENLAGQENKLSLSQNHETVLKKSKRKRNFKEKQNLSLHSAIKLAFHNMWASKTKNILMSIGVAIGIGSLILMMCFSSGITDFISNTMKSYSDPTIVTISKKPPEGSFMNFGKDAIFSEEEKNEVISGINSFLESENESFRVDNQFENEKNDGNVSYGFNMFTFAGITASVSYSPDGTEENTVSKQIYCLYSIPPYYSKTNVVEGEMSKGPTKEEADGQKVFRGGFMFTKGISQLVENPVGKNVKVTINVSATGTKTAVQQQTTLAAPDQPNTGTNFVFDDQICGIMDTSVMSGYLVMYVDFNYLQYMFNQNPVTQSLFGPTALYIKTPNEQITNKINTYLSSTGAYTGSLEDTFAGMFNSMSSTIGTSLVVISCISLLVSAMMILVVLYMSVSERTKEIGVLKSIGARRKDIKRIFTSESFLIGVLSGICGIIFNLLLTLIVWIVLTNTIGIAPISYRWWYFAVAIGVSICISMLSGLYPASKAAKLDPVESLRRE